MSIRIRQTVLDEPMPVGEYVARIEKIEQQAGQYGEQLRFRFTVAAGEHEGRTLTGWTSCSFSPKSKLYRWTQAAFGGAAIPRTWDFDADALLGRLVRLVVIMQTGDDGQRWNKIQDVLAR